MALTMAQDYLEGRSDYQFFDGAMAVSQVAKLGMSLEGILRLGGDVSGKIGELLRYPGDDPDNIIYELLTGFAFQQKGFDARFVPTEKSKTPDLRIDFEDISVFIECKRKAQLTGYERQEASLMLELFACLRAKLIDLNIAGKFDLKFFSPIDEVSLESLADGCAKAIRQRGTIYYSWGAVNFAKLPLQMTISTTRLYSPNFLSEVAGYRMDLPNHDGLVIQVSGQNQFEVEKAFSPTVLTWTVLSAKANEKKTRAVSSLFGKAVGQFPPGSIGFPYICYTETKGDHLANQRTVKLLEEMTNSHHAGSIRVPETHVNRLYAAPTAHGSPDLIENCMHFRASYLDEDFEVDFPSLIFTEEGC